MADLQSSTITSAVTPNLSGANAVGAASGVTAVQVAVSTVPETLATLARTIQTNATPAALIDNTLNLSTPSGTVTVTLPQLSATALQQNIVQQLLNLLNTQRPLTLSLQPGSPPTQAILLIPSAPQALNQTSAQPTNAGQGTATTPSVQNQIAPVIILAKGQILPALVLPSNSFTPLPVSATSLSYAPPIAFPATGQQAPPPVVSSLVASGSPQASTPAPSIPVTSTNIPTPIIATAITASGTAPPPAVTPPPALPAGSAPPVASPTPSPAAPLPLTVQPITTVSANALSPTTPAILPQTPQPAISVPINSLPPLPVVPNSDIAPPPSPATPSAATPSVPIPPTILAAAPAQTTSTPSPAPVLATTQAPLPQLSSTPTQPAPAPSGNAVVPAAPLAAPAPPASPALLQPGTEVTLQIDDILPPTTGTALPPAPLNLAANQIIATVTGNTPDGKLIVQSGDAILFVKAQVAAPAGTNLVLTVEAAKDPPLLPIPASEPQNFQALPQAMATLAQVNPQALMQMLATHIPQPTESLAGTLLLLLSAFKQSDARSWLGDSVADSLLNAGKGDLVSSLSRELGNGGQTTQDPVVGEWRAYPVPLYSQQQFQAVTLYVHSDRNPSHGRERDAQASGKIRFLIDMRLSKLGSMQIDGFVQPKKLDMIVRSENLLPAGLHNELRTAYIKAIGAVGYAGALNFQVGRQHWLMMQKNVPQGIVT